MGKQLGFYVDLGKCTGCKACQIACKDNSNLPLGVNYRRVVQYTGGDWVQDGDLYIPAGVYTYYVSVACMHCANPLCVEGCPTGAMYKREEDGVVLIDPSKCVGCRYCEWACPYGAPQFDAEAGIMTKCDFCVDEQAAGEKPVCVAGCPFRALDYGDIDELRAKYGDFADPAPLPDPSITRPSVVFSPHKNTRTSKAADGQVVNVEEAI